MADVQTAGDQSGEAEKQNKKQILNSIKEEAYFFIGCLYRLRKTHKLQGFNADFTKKMFGPYILNKLFRCDADIKKAVRLWCSDPVEAEKKYGHISKWYVSHVTDMDLLFSFQSKFNEDIRAWDVSNVTTMQNTFTSAFAFNQPIGDWDTSKVESMECMFGGASSFNQPIGNWDVSKVENMSSMFSSASAFNQSLLDWDVSKVKNMGSMFIDARSFNQPLSRWNIENVRNRSSMFLSCPITKKRKPLTRSQKKDKKERKRQPRQPRQPGFKVRDESWPALPSLHWFIEY